MTKKQIKIRVRGLKKSFGDKIVLGGIDFDLHAGESLGIIGGSGTGKSVLIKCILGLIRPDSGTIEIDGVDLSTVSSARRLELVSQIGMLFQGGALFDSMPVWENVAFGLIQGKGMPPQEAKEIALEMLKSVNLDESTADIFPAELSGGMQKRVALARAIAKGPQVIFFDEPTTGLDPIVSGTINQLIIDHVRKLGAAAITITHDIHSLRIIADQVGLLFDGRLIWKGSVQEMDKTKDSYVTQFIHGLPKGPFTNS